MIGIPSSESSTTDAPMMPVEAASRMPMSVTVTASPPRTRPKTREKFTIRSLAIPDRSSIRPMKMKSGSATSTQLFIVSQMRSTTSPLYAQSTPVTMPRSRSAMIARAENATARPPSTHATGKPEKMSPMNEANIATASHSAPTI